jgi:uncharacterized protein (DUF2147 family)
MKICTLLSAFLLMASTVFGAVPGIVLGTWKTDGGDSQLELFKCADKVCGKVVWLKVPKYIDSKDGPVGATKVDRKCSDPAQRNRPIIGLQVMKGLTAKGGNRWDNGVCYDPETGKSYKCKMRLTAPNRLELRGYIGISLIGRNFSLTR